MIKTKYVKLDNGLVVALAKDNKLHSFGADILIKYGSHNKSFYSDDNLYKCEDGIAHLLEHVIIENSPYGNIGKYFSDNYYSYNGITSSEYTKYYIFGYENFYDNLKILVDSVNNSAFTSEGIEKCKGAVIEEIGEKHNKRTFKFFKTVRESLFNEDVAIDGLGTVESVKDFSYDDLKLIYDTFYQPDNEVISVYGNFDEKKVLEVINDCFKSYNRTYKKHKIKEFVDTLDVKNRYVEYVKPNDMSVVSINTKYDISRFNKKELARLENYLRWYLDYNFNSESEFGTRIFKEGISPYQVYTSNSTQPYDDAFGILTFKVPTNECEKFVSMVFEQLEKREMPSKLKKEIYKKKKYIARLINLDNAHFLATEFAFNYLFNNELKFKTIKDLDDFSFDEMEEFIKELDFTHYSVVYQKDK